MKNVTPEMMKPLHTVTSETDPSNLPLTHKNVEGYDFNKGIDYKEILKSYATTGIQSKNLSRAIEIVQNMLAWRGKEGEKAKIFLGYTSSAVTSGVRDLIRFLVEHKLVDVIVTSAGGIEEDFMKCNDSHFIANFREDDEMLRDKGIKRIGNVITTSGHYNEFVKKFTPLVDQMLEKQEKEGKVWGPSDAIDFWGESINDPKSIYYWTHKNNIPVFCPGFTDGAIGELLVTHHENNEKKIRIDVVNDVRGVCHQAMHSTQTGVLILGGGVIKHHILNANLMRNGANFAVYINTAQEFDGSDSGAKPTEALSWGKLALNSERVKVYTEFSLVMPLIISEAFYPELLKRQQEEKEKKEAEKVEKVKA